MVRPRQWDRIFTSAPSDRGGAMADGRMEG